MVKQLTQLQNELVAVKLGLASRLLIVFKVSKDK